MAGEPLDDLAQIWLNLRRSDVFPASLSGLFGCPLSVAPTDFSQADELIRRAREHTARWIAAGTPEPAHAGDLVWPHQHLEPEQ